MALQNFERHIELPAAGMDRKCSQQPRGRLRHAGMKRERIELRGTSAKDNLGSERDEIGRRSIRVGFELGERAHRLVIKIEPASIYESPQPG